MSGFLGVPVDAAYLVVTALSALLAPLAGGLTVAVSIVVFTIAVRLLLLPFSYYAMRGQAAQARIAPHVQALRQRYAKQPDRLRRELAALHEQNGSSMYAGCLPLLLQWPFLSVMYLLFRSPAISGAPNTLLAHYLFGAQLGSHWLSGTGPLSVHGAVFAALLALLAAIGWLSARAARRMSRPAFAPGASAVRGPGGTSASAVRPAGAGPGQSAPPPVPPVPAGPAWLTQLTPYVTVVIAAFMPLAAGLYLVTTTAWTLLERSLLGRALTRAAAAAEPEASLSGTRRAFGGDDPDRP